MLDQTLRKAQRFGRDVLARRLAALSGTQPNPSWLRGDFSTWRDAVAASRGYDSPDILEAVKRSAAKVHRGEAVYERDSVLLDHVEYSWPLLAGLMWEAAASGGRLNVLDFGGSLGTTYRQNRRFLSDLSEVRWNIVEQPQFVREGRALFQSEALRFYESIEECLNETAPTVAVMSGVLPYVERPYDLLAACLADTFRTVVIDRTFVWDGDRDRLRVQDVPETIFPASYPLWILSKPRLLAALSRHELVAEFPGFADESHPECQPQGFIIRHRGGNYANL